VRSQALQVSRLMAVPRSVHVRRSAGRKRGASRIGSPCRSADKGNVSGYCLLWEYFEQREFEESIRLEDDVQAGRCGR